MTNENIVKNQTLLFHVLNYHLMGGSWIKRPGPIDSEYKVSAQWTLQGKNNAQTRDND